MNEAATAAADASRSLHPNAPGNARDVPAHADATPRRVLPHNLEAEASVVGGILLRPAAFIDAVALVAPEDFYHPANAAIFGAMIELDEAGKPIDQLVIAEHMRAAGTFGKLRALGGEAYFAELTSAVITVENIAFHARMVRGKATVRKLIEASQEIAAHGYGDYGDVEEFISRAEESILAVTTSRAPSKTEQIATVGERVVKGIQERAEKKETVIGMRSGLVGVDEMIHGFQAPKYYCLAARPSEGKTALAFQWLEAVARGGDAVLGFSIEMDLESVAERVLSGDANIDGDKLRSGSLSPQDWTALYRAQCNLEHLEFHVNHEAETLPQIRAAARAWSTDVYRRWQSRNADAIERGMVPIRRPRLLFAIDYLQLMEANQQRGETESQAIARMSRGVKGLLKELHAAGIVLAQLNREAEKEKRRPRPSDLRGSGQIEQDADLIGFLYSEDPPSKASRATELIIAKQRGGDRGTVPLRFVRPITRFFDEQPWFPADQGSGGDDE